MSTAMTPSELQPRMSDQFRKRDLFEQRHSAELALYEAAVWYLKNLKAAGEPISPKKWQAETDKLTTQIDLQYQQMKAHA